MSINLSKIHLWLVLVSLFFTAVEVQAQQLFQFDFTADTNVSSTAPVVSSATYSNAGLDRSFIGNDGFGNVLEAYPNGMGPGATTAAAALANGIFFEIDFTTSAPINATSLSYEVGKGGASDPRGYFVRSSVDGFLTNLISVTLPAGAAANPAPASIDLSSLSGYTALTDATFRFYVWTPGAGFSVDFRNLALFGSLFVPPAAPGGGGRQRQQLQTVYLVDAGAMYSLTNSGLPMGLALRDVSRGAADTGLRGVNDRLKRAQSRGLGQGNTVTSNNSSSLLRYLAFVGDENMSYKVALGLADPEERTIEINMTDTLSAQVGTNFNGSTMSGGLPYAMMGVPLMPIAGGAATVHVVEAAPSGKTVLDDPKAVVEDTVWKRWEVFAAGDFSFYDQDQLSDLMEGFDTDTYAGSVGLEYRAKPWLNLGLAWSYLESDTNVSGNLGNIDLDGNLISGYATAFWRQYWGDILYSYGSFNSDIKRNTGLGSTARGDTDSQSNNIRLNFGRNFQVGSNVVTGPIAGLRYANGDVDSYSETGGGTAALNYNSTEFESMVSRVGWQASHVRPTGWGRIVSQAHLAWEHEFMPENGTVGAGLQTSPFSAVTGGSVRRFGGFSSESDGAHPGTDWMSAGAGLRFALDNGFAIRADYEGAFFRSNAIQHYASAKVSYEW